LKDIKQASVRAEHILELVALATGNVNVREEKIDLKALLEDLVNGFPKQERTELKLSARDSIWIRGDRGLLQRAFENLLWNAYDALRDSNGGTVHVTLGREGNRAILSFEDSGPGVQPEILPKLFIPFQTTKKDGLGLGLYQVKVFIELNKGSIEIQSEEGKGATFTIFLPATR
jgi:signal transduction histidine kinase